MIDNNSRVEDDRIIQQNKNIIYNIFIFFFYLCPAVGKTRW